MVRVEERPGLALATEPESDGVPKTAFVRADVVGLVREKRYEEALAVLYRARAESPSDREVQKSIGQIKEFLIGAYAKRLGGLDQVARPIPLTAVRSPDALLLARYIDGTSTFGDVAQICPLGQLRSLQVLVALYSGTESARRVDAAPPSGLRMPDGNATEPGTESARIGAGEMAPYEPRPGGAPPGEPAPSSTPAPFSTPVVETEEARHYRETFARGTAAFIQRRYADAVEAFEACDRLRPGDRAASVMLRRSLRDLESL
jgi:hypothetical protein